MPEFYYCMISKHDNSNMFKWNMIILVTNETIDINNFAWFLKILDDWLRSHNYFGHSHAMLLLDNYSINKSSLTVIVLQTFSFITLFILAFSSYFPSIEQWYSLKKRKLSEIYKIMMIELKYGKTIQKYITPWFQSKQLQLNKIKRFYRVTKEHLLLIILTLKINSINHFFNS